MNLLSNKLSANRRRSFTVVCLAVAVAILCTSCVNRFVEIKVEPLQACSGNLVEVEWQTNDFDTTTLTSNPTVSGLPKTVSGDQSGTDTFQVEKTTSFSLKGTIGVQSPQMEEASTTVTIVPEGGASVVLEFTPGSVGELPVWETAVLSEEFAGSLIITSVQNVSDLEFTVTHAGKTALVELNTVSTFWNGDPLVGSWEATAELLEDLPPPLKLLVSYSCP